MPANNKKDIFYPPPVIITGVNSTRLEDKNLNLKSTAFTNNPGSKIII